ncbi:hypothetical protein G7047_19210 [Diaphorobacter sp. HDW4A]|uniref:hypothetical protein n=1 Tax=Diaphorobacter sp. HDW4A TaxID=2714924 RepID=UPI00140B5CB6|nr:hypothetical protein [Diaphorobacter sp. HDW4A]QIL81807.1 hypothetical protein G7047_19210 [Diaphorobacter sp. HDW4A]
MTMQISRDHRAARNQASIDLADAGNGPSVIELYDAQGGNLLAVRTLDKPCGVINAEGRIVLQPSLANDMVQITGKPTFAVWRSGAGAAIALDAVTDQLGSGPFKLEGTSIGEDGLPTGMIYQGGVVALTSPMLVG